MLIEARFFRYDIDRLTGARTKTFLGSARLDDSNTSYAFPLAAKAFRHAPEKARGASRVEFVRISHREEATRQGFGSGSR